ncbi:MAG: metallophosphoesterase [Bacteroidetes bacterium]|nr:metallophosphoesterase [Bacteroidota bacterium]
MKKESLITLAVSLLFINFLSIQFSCNKSEEPNISPVGLSVSFPLLTYYHSQYYLLKHDTRSIELVFSNVLNDETVAGNLLFFDKSGSLSTNYDLIIDGKLIFIRFHDDFFLNDGWKYDLQISKGLRSVEGFSVSENEIIELRTTAKHISDGLVVSKTDTTQRTLIACISDIHCGDQRANDGNYSWFGTNSAALADYLEFVKNNQKVKELVILGDLFDEWMVPYFIQPFDSSVNITSSGDYFKAIANSTVNKPVFDKFREIIAQGEIDVIYVPGNHDMLLTQEVLEEIIPNIIWKSDVTGLGKYYPVDEIVMEHGHRYDFFNCPQSLVNNGHILPPGYFITRLYASGLSNRPRNTKETENTTGDFEFNLAWKIATGYTISHFSMIEDTLYLDSNNVLMTGIDNYPTPFSFNGARNMYDVNIENLWTNTQQINKVPVPSSVFLAILNGNYLYGAALFEYLTDYLSSDQPKVVAFGHSHEPDIKVFPMEDFYTGIYANSGSWLDAGESKYNVRTFLIINPAIWSGSELDVVSLYQYNLDSDGQGNTYKPVLMKEESIKH